jgi:hypothetical protein
MAASMKNATSGGRRSIFIAAKVVR